MPGISGLLQAKFTCRKVDIFRKTVTKGSLMLVRIATVLKDLFTTLNRNAQKQDKGKYSHADETTTQWATTYPFTWDEYSMRL